MSIVKHVGQDGKWTLLHGDCVEAMRGMPDNSVHSVVSDPPYLLAFQGQAWDSTDNPVAFHRAWAREALRVLKPGGYVLAFAGDRTYHHLAVGLEAEGAVIRGMLAFCHMQGFPKGLDISKGFDKNVDMAERRGYIPVRAGIGKGSERRVIQFRGKHPGMYLNPDNPISSEAKTWHGWGTRLKDSLEPICIAQKPLAGSVLDNIRQHGVGALHIDACRVPLADGVAVPKKDGDLGWANGEAAGATEKGYHPANLILDENVAAALDSDGAEVSRLFFCPKPAGGELVVKETQVLRIREDLNQQEREFLLAELTRLGVKPVYRLVAS